MVVEEQSENLNVCIIELEHEFFLLSLQILT